MKSNRVHQYKVIICNEHTEALKYACII